MPNSLQSAPARPLLDRLFQAGRLLYALVRASRPATVVEFGTSFGVSAIHLAAAVADNGAGHVISTELNAAKAAAARANLAEAGLAGWATVVEGDALQTLAEVDAPVGFVLLDGWKYLYLPVLRLLEPRLTPGALVVADDSVSQAREMGNYLGYVREPGNGYLSVSFPESDGMEISLRV